MQRSAVGGQRSAAECSWRAVGGQCIDGAEMAESIQALCQRVSQRHSEAPRLSPHTGSTDSRPEQGSLRGHTYLEIVNGYCGYGI